MPEVQAHGKSWERELATGVFGLTSAEFEAISHTAIHDVPGELNRLTPGVSISVKTTCSPNSVGMGDPLRIFDTVYSAHPIHVVVIVYAQDCAANTKTVELIVEMDITGMGRELFGSLTRADLEELVRRIHAVPKELRGRVIIDGKKVSAPSAQRTAYLEKQVELLGKTGALFLNPKVDETNCRLQSSLNKFQKFLTDYPDRIIARSTDGNFRGAKISMVIESSQRKFTKRNNLKNEEWATAVAENGALEAMTVTQLKKGAKTAGIAQSGKKGDLVERLRGHYSAMKKCVPCEDDLGGVTGGSRSRNTRKNRH